MTRSRANQEINDCEIKWSGDYVDLVLNEGHYEMLHEKDFIACLPVISNSQSTETIFTIREEYCPAYNLKGEEGSFFYTLITGKIDSTDTNSEEAMLREVREEAGLDIDSYTVVEKVSNVPIHKTTDARCTFFMIDLHEYDLVPAEGDGSEAEKISNCFPTVTPLSYLEKDHDFLLNYGYLQANKHGFLNMEEEV